MTGGTTRDMATGGTARPRPRPVRGAGARTPRTASRGVELELCAQNGLVAGMDEVGRGALAGPVAVGVAVVDASCGEPPEGLTDSKCLTPRRREALCGPVEEWVLASAVGWAGADEVDRFGIIVALRLAGLRALEEVRSSAVEPGIVLLDGSHDWLTPPEDTLFPAEGAWDADADADADADGYEGAAAAPAAGLPAGLSVGAMGPGVPVVTRVRADLECAVVSAASVLAKVRRDARMCALPDPGYDWVHNKGYASPSHVEALGRLGPCELHRRSWHLPGVVPAGAARPSTSPMRPAAGGEGMMGL